MDPIERERWRMARLRVLEALNIAAPRPVGDGIILRALAEDLDLDLDISSVRKIFDYLAGLKLVAITYKHHSTPWLAKITPQGTNFLEGVGPNQNGIASPEEY